MSHDPADLLKSITVLAFSNGGSARDTERLVAELVGRFEVERRRLPAVSLMSDSSVMTAIANDYGCTTVVKRQVESARLSDVAVGISTSGRSKNVAAGLPTAKAHGLLTIALTGRDGGRMESHSDIHVNVGEQSTACMQEVHRPIVHAMCALIDHDGVGLVS
jgi:D-sedoheptulose 7-phosphate isomerase